MRKLLWREITRPGDCVHVANILMGRMRSPAMHDHDFYECFLILEGSGKHHRPQDVERLEPRRMYFVRPEHAHCIRGGSDLSFLNLAFKAEVFDALRRMSEWGDIWREGGGIHSVTLDARQVERVMAAAAEVSRRPSRLHAAWLLLSVGRIVVQDSEDAVLRESMPGWFADGLAVAGEQSVLQEGLSALTRRMGRSRKHVTRCFRHYLNQTPTEWLNRNRIEHAGKLLATTSLPVLEIAFDCGFSSPSYFHKCFRETYGMSPARYRRSLSRVHG